MARAEWYERYGICCQELERRDMHLNAKALTASILRCASVAAAENLLLRYEELAGLRTHGDRTVSGESPLPPRQKLPPVVQTSLIDMNRDLA